MSRDNLNRALAATTADYRADIHPQHRIERCLVKLYTLGVSIPPAIAQSYETLRNADIDKAVGERVRMLTADELEPRWPDLDVVAAETDDQIVFQVAAELRALERALIEIRDPGTGGTDDPETEFRVDGTDHYLIPVPALAHTRKTFARSGLRNHRVLPFLAQDVRLRLYAAPYKALDAGCPNRLAGSLFSGFGLEITPGDPPAPFSAVAVNCPDQIEQINDHVDGLHAGDRCLAAAWPELTCPPNAQAAIKNRLKRWPLGAATKPPVVAVPGSWHEDDGRRVNRTIVLGGSGDPLLIVEKRMRYVFGGRPEDIQYGEELPILILGERLIAFGICRDYCEGMVPTPYDDLPVDVTLVPSMGDATTVGAHAAAAERAYLHRGARAFVVQQDHLADADGQGWVDALGRVVPGGPPRRPAGIHFSTL